MSGKDTFLKASAVVRVGNAPLFGIRAVNGEADNDASILRAGDAGKLYDLC